MKISTVLAMVVALVAAVAGLAYLTGNQPPKPQPVAAAPTTPDGKTPEAAPADEPDFHLTNPFNLDTKAAKKPVASVDDVEFKFEPMAPQEERSHKFKIKNTGEAELNLAKGRYLCKCTMPTIKKGEVVRVAPGGETEIEMTWKPLAPDPMFHKTVEIWTNDPDHPKLTFSVQGEVIPHIVAEPSSFSLGLMRNETGGPFEGFLSSATDDYEILDTTSDNPLISATVERVDRAAFPVELKDAKTVYRILGKIGTSDKIGTISGNLSFKTNLEAHKEVSCPVTAQLMGPFMILGFGWDQTKTSLDVGRVETSQGKTTKFGWFLPKSDKEFELTSVESKPNFVKLTVTKDANFNTVDRDKYDLAVEVVPGAPKGEFNIGRPVFVKVTTNHPNVPEITFKIFYRGY